MCHMISMENAHYPDGGGYVVWTCHNIDIEEGVWYKTTKTAQGIVGGCTYLEKMIFYTQSYHNLDFILLWLNPDVRQRSP